MYSNIQLQVSGIIIRRRCTVLYSSCRPFQSFKKSGRKLISLEETVLECLPVIFETKRTKPGHKTVEAGQRSILPVERLRTLHILFECCLKLLQMVSKTGLSVERNNRQKCLLYIFGLLCSRPSRSKRSIGYEATFSDINSFSYLFLDTAWVSIQHYCGVSNLELYETGFELLEPKQKEHCGWTYIKTISMYPDVPVLSFFPFIGVHSCVEL